MPGAIIVSVRHQARPSSGENGCARSRTLFYLAFASRSIAGVFTFFDPYAVESSRLWSSDRNTTMLGCAAAPPPARVALRNNAARIAFIRLLLLWPGRAPVHDELRQLLRQVRFLRRQVLRFVHVRREVVQLRARTIRVHQQLPVVPPHCEIRAPVRPEPEELVV